jgi:hypothetical protein
MNKNTLTVCHVPTDDVYEFEYEGEVEKCLCRRDVNELAGLPDIPPGKFDVETGDYNYICPHCGRILKTLRPVKIKRKQPELKIVS